MVLKPPRTNRIETCPKTNMKQNTRGAAVAAVIVAVGVAALLWIASFGKSHQHAGTSDPATVYSTAAPPASDAMSATQTPAVPDSKALVARDPHAAAQ
jgi:hypothetical protein